MYMVSIDAEKCEGCGECVDACPAAILEMVDGKAVVTGSETDCMGCETCVVTCPHEAPVIQEL
ncbi:MAG: 4Fe-4S dicluster domain-containing protein [Firmicutes bacterium]|nr:4Fe-4S dicluster domain-containing protein [Bacillota bacterium]